MRTIGNRLIRRQFISYLLVGVLNTGFGYGAYTILILLNFPHFAALALGNIAGAAFNFFTTGRLVFKNKDSGSIIRFAAASILLFGFNALLLEFVTSLRIGPIVAQGICLFAVVPTGFSVMRCWVFAQKKK